MPAATVPQTAAYGAYPATYPAQVFDMYIIAFASIWLLIV